MSELGGAEEKPASVIANKQVCGHEEREAAHPVRGGHTDS